MSSALTLRTTVPLSPGQPGGFGHGDVDQLTGCVFVAHTAFDSVEVIDPDTLKPAGRIEGCLEGSGVLCASEARLVFAAARGAGKVLVIDADRLAALGEIAVGPRPNGLAWDGARGPLLVADVEPADQSARLIDVASGVVVASTPLPGRPRWCVYEPTGDRYLVNISEPAGVVVLAGGTGVASGVWTVGASGPHGLDLDRESMRAFIACDGGHVIAVNLDGEETGRTAISGAPDAIWFNARRRRLYVANRKTGRDRRRRHRDYGRCGDRCHRGRRAYDRFRPRSTAPVCIHARSMCHRGL